MAKTNQEAIYQRLILELFRRHRKGKNKEGPFTREDIVKVAKGLELTPPKNLGDLIYTYRFRRQLPQEIRKSAPTGMEWVIRLAGTAKYKFALTALGNVQPNRQLRVIKIPDATPGLIAKYKLTDEQALLAIVRYNRLLDVFTGVACYSLQSHLRTQVESLGQTEIDELYIGIDRSGAHYVLPVQAKGGRDKLGAVQIEQDLAVCKHKFPALVCRPIGAQFMDGLVVLYEFVDEHGDLRIAHEAHYKLVPPSEISEDDLKQYRRLLTA